jgi:photosystem II stability/assembly factor-like uncharacterized protein
VAISASIAILTIAPRRSTLPRATGIRPHPTRVPLTFERNVGQTTADVDYLAHAQGYSLELSHATARVIGRSGTATLALVGGRSNVAAERVDGGSGTVNYFIGNDPSRWLTGISTAAHVRYRDVYPQIDLVYRAAGSDIEYDFVVNPGGDPRRIALSIDAPGVELDATGDLLMSVAQGRPPIRHRRPHVYQTVHGALREVQSAFVKRSDGAIGVDLGPYDPQYTLTIDPIVVFSTALGGGHDGASSVAVDAHGEIYVAGAAGEDLPVSSGAAQRTLRGGVDAFIAKIDATGSNLIYATYLGGTNSRQDYEANSEVAWGIAVDSAGNACVTGQTQSTDFPVVNAFQSSAQARVSKGFDAFVTKLNHAGSALLFSTYLGGSNGNSAGRAIVVDAAGNVFVAGDTFATQFPATTRLGPAGTVRPAFVAKFNHAGGMVYLTTIGGARDLTIARAIAVDSAGQAHVAGDTAADDFPIEHGWRPDCPRGPLGYCTLAFLAKLSASGAHVVYSTFLGGEMPPFGDRTSATGVAVDGVGNAIVTGVTSSRVMPTIHALQPSYAGGQRDGFVASFTPVGSVRYSTYLGGNGDEVGVAIAADPAGHAYLVGATYSADFPLVEPIAGISPTGPLFRSGDSGESWTTPTRELGRPITTVVIDPTVPDTMYAAVLYDGVYKSTDAGAHWTRRSTGLPDNMYTRDLAIAPSNPGTLYVSTFGAVYKTIDGGIAWTPTPVESGGPLAADPRTADTVYTAGGGSVFKTTDGGRTWRKLSLVSGGAFVDVAGIAIGAGAPDTVYVASNGTALTREKVIFKSIDGGESWASVSNGLAATFLDQLAIDPDDSNTLYAAGDGVFKSSDGARTWTRVLGGNAAVVTIARAPQRAVYAATAGSRSDPCLQRSLDGGATWGRTDRGVRRRDGSCGIVTLAADPRRPTRIIAAGSSLTMPFLTRLTAAGSIDYSTYLEEDAAAIAADLAGNAYVAGSRLTLDNNLFLSKFGVEKIAPHSPMIPR